MKKISYTIIGDSMETLKIFVNLSNLEEIHHPFHNNTLNPTLGNFLYDACIGKERRKKIDIHISSSDAFSLEEKKFIRDLIHSHFLEESKEIQLKKQISFRFYLFLCFMGLFFLLLSFLSISPFFDEIFLILGWIAIWEFVENLLFSQKEDSICQIRFKRLSQARVYFDQEENPLL